MPAARSALQTMPTRPKHACLFGCAGTHLHGIAAWDIDHVGDAEEAAGITRTAVLRLVGVVVAAAGDGRRVRRRCRVR